MSFRIAQLPETPANDRDNSIQLTIPPSHPQSQPPHNQSQRVDYTSRAQWLRAAILGANDGIVSVASLMIGVGAVNSTNKAMLVSGLAGLVAGASSMAVGEFTSVRAQYDIEVAQMNRQTIVATEEEVAHLPSPARAAGASFLAFAIGAVLPLLAGGFIHRWWVRVVVVCVVTSLGLGGFGASAAVLGGAHVWRSTARVLLGGWLAMLFSYGVVKAFGFAFGAQQLC